jgi:LEA14-like dessication related protein
MKNFLSIRHSKSVVWRIACCLLSVGFFSCKEIQPVTIGGIENVKLHKLSREGIEFDLGIKIKNPNKIGITVFPASFALTINDIDAGNIKLNKKVKIKGNSDEVLIFQIKSDFSKLRLEDITKVLSIISSKSATIYIKGEIKVGKWYYRKKIPVEMMKTISLSK